MSSQLVSILVLVAVFLIATVLPVHMGALALVAAFVFGYFLFGADEYADMVFGFFPGSLFVIDPKIDNGEKPPAVAPLMMNRPMRTGLIE